jgi:hypothetical protein
MQSHMVGALPWLGAIFDHGMFLAWLGAVMASWGMMNLLAITLERRVLIPSQQYQSFYKGDLVGLPVIVAMIQPMLGQLPSGHHWYQSALWHWLAVVVGAVVGVAFMAMEYQSGIYTKAQLFSPLKLYHNLIVFPLFIYWVFAAGVPALIYSSLGVRGVLEHGWQPTLLLVGLLAAAGYWVRLVLKELQMSEEEHAQKRAHVAVSPREAVPLMPACVMLGVVLALGSHEARTAMLTSAVCLGGFAYYGATVGFETAGKAGPKPWAHVPFKLSYAMPWRKKPWPFWTRGLAAPWAVAT